MKQSDCVKAVRAVIVVLGLTILGAGSAAAQTNPAGGSTAQSARGDADDGFDWGWLGLLGLAGLAGLKGRDGSRVTTR